MNKIKRIVNFLRERYGYPSFSKDKFRLLITTILSQRTRDENTEKVSKKLFSIVDGPEDIVKMPTKKLESIIKSSGTYKQKAKRIKQTSKIILEKYDGEVPKTRKELMELPGVGYKTADIVLSYGFKVPTIAVDVHVNRIPKRIGIVDKEGDVEEVREKLESKIKGKDRFLVNLGLVRFGQEICRPTNPKCEECPLKKICNYYKNKK